MHKLRFWIQIHADPLHPELVGMSPKKRKKNSNPSLEKLTISLFLSSLAMENISLSLSLVCTAFVSPSFPLSIATVMKMIAEVMKNCQYQSASQTTSNTKTVGFI